MNFDPERWQRIKKDADLWWQGELGRPLIQFTVRNSLPNRPEPSVPRQNFHCFYDHSVSAEAIIDRCDWDISRQTFLGDAFPSAFFNFGPGVVAALLGGKLEPGMETVWFGPAEERPIDDIKWGYDPDNYWLNRIKSLKQVAIDRWGGQVLVSMTDLGGNMDLLASFRPGIQLLLDLTDNREGVKVATWKAHDFWWRYWDEFNNLLQPTNPGYSAWTSIFSSDPYYMLQCDFCYMISPDMFDEFVKPELEATCRKLTNPFYHLDGPGELPHLDSLLSIKELKGIQWIPGAGAPESKLWPEVYRKIRDAGKLIQLFGDVETLDTVVDQLGGAENIVLIGSERDEDRAIDCLKRYGVPV